MVLAPDGNAHARSAARSASPGAIAIGRGASSLLFDVKGSDPVVLALAAVILAVVAFGAGFIPAVRASRVDPMQALRYE